MARIVVAMSGGVDSSVAAALLKEQGHEVIGIMLRLWSEPGVIEDDGVERVSQNKCCSLESVDDARRVARMLDIPFYLVNVEQEFKENVVDLFYQEEVQEPQLVGVGARATTAQASGVIQIPRPGPIFDANGKTLGRHRGLAYYTIGQRKGLGITSPEPMHVLKIDAEQNALVVGP